MAKHGSGISARVGANLVAIILFGVGMVVFAFLNFVTGIAFDNSYRATATIDDAGGVLPRQEVTVRGRAVGTVESAELTDDGRVLLTFKIQPQFPVPQDATVEIMRRSPIGEQAIELRPDPPTGWTPLDPNGDGAINVVGVPDTTTVEELLTNTVSVFQDVDTRSLATIITELAAAFDGRADVIRDLNEVSVDVGRTLLAGQDEFRRLLDTSQPLLSQLDRHADDLVRLFRNVADLNEVLAANRGNLEDLLRVGPSLFHEAESLIVAIRPNAQCLIDDLTAVNAMLLGPSTADGAPTRFYDTKLDEVQMGIDMHRYFFQLGVPLLLQTDPETGVPWARVRFLTDHLASGQPYPELRPTPATLPGAACETDAWGTGVNAVRQADPQDPDPGSPGILYAPLVEERRPTPPPPPAGTIGARPALPATGGGLIMLAATSIGAALLLYRRR